MGYGKTVWQCPVLWQEQSYSKCKNGVSPRLTIAALLAIVLMAGVLAAACGGGGPAKESAKQAEEHLRQASALVDKANWAEAIEHYTKAIELNPKSDLAYEGRGIAYTELGKLDEALADLNKGVELRPDRGGPRYARGVAYRLKGNLDQAIADLSQVIGDRNKSRFSRAIYQRGLAYREKGLLSEAGADFQRILQLEAENPGQPDREALEGARKALAEMGQY